MTNSNLGLIASDKKFDLISKIFDTSLEYDWRIKLAKSAYLLLGKEKCNATFLGFLSSERAHIRALAIYALGFIGNKEALPALKSALNDRSAKVQASAVRAICSLKNGSNSDRLLVDILLKYVMSIAPREALKSALSGLMLFFDHRAEEGFCANVTHPWLEIRLQSLKGLLFYCSEEGLKCARKALQDLDASVRKKAIEIVEVHGERCDIERLFPLLGDKNKTVKEASVLALNSLRNQASRRRFS